ncbi:zinc-ribbon domain-containing protein [Metallosphaera hakonensis]|uniref:zinc-ribbon domain-containing protein n=1 Tax=Metallosphaera hakonensis TaxID=79601 RepID=UPI0035717717
MVLVCPACGQSNPDGSTFCGYCGRQLVSSPLQGSSPSPAVPTLSPQRKILPNCNLNRVGKLPST